MKYIYKVREKAGEYFLGRKLRLFTRDRKFIGFDKARSVGIIFNASDKDNFELVKKYVTYLRESQKKVMALGFFDMKEVPELKYTKIEYNFFATKDLNWHLVPESNFIDNFIKEEYDILIDLNLDDNFSLKYISALSKAKFKIGKFTEGSSMYDFMIVLEEDKGIKYFLKHLDHYLLQMSPGEKK